MRYQSTRGGVTQLPFCETVMMGMAEDGGLLLPESIPQFSSDQLEQLIGKPFNAMAEAILGLFIDDIPQPQLRRLIQESYTSFNHPEVTPVRELPDCYLLELFHGPTLAFKDVALQWLGNLFEYLLQQQGEHLNILGATSGDTGSAAIYGVRGKERINIYILHPQGRVSPIQERQMTSVLDANVYNLAVDGTFDDCQRLMKEIFADVPFKQQQRLGAINSINWARVLAQTVYYFYAWSRLRQRDQQKEVCFSVPTGNFGDIFAGYLAKRMGLPIQQLILATNENNILTRFVRDGDYSISEVVSTLSPSMDIQIASNFERYLYYLLDGDSEQLLHQMQQFKHSGRLQFPKEQIDRIQQDFLAQDVSRQQTLETIRHYYEHSGVILDPHTAVGVRAGMDQCPPGYPLISLGTAHAAKFPQAVQEAIGCQPPVPEPLHGIMDKPCRCQQMPADVDAIKELIQTQATQAESS